MAHEGSRAAARIGAATRVLVTGGAGFIGSHLVDVLRARDASVVVLDDLSTGDRGNLAHSDSGDVDLVEGSTNDEALVDRLMADADLCYHLASAVGVQLVVSNPLDSLLKNVRGTDIVMAAAARHGTRLLFTSTSEVYGKNSSGSLDEEAARVLGSPFKARWCYETSKAFGECLAHSYHRDQGALHDGGAALQHRRPASGQPVRHGRADLRPSGAGRPSPDGLRRRQPDALLLARDRHRPRPGRAH